MKHLWNAEELSLHWVISFDEMEKLATINKNNRLGFILQLKHYQYQGLFPSSISDIGDLPTQYICDQLDFNNDDPIEYDFKGRTARRHREEILEMLGIRKSNPQDKKELTQWLENEVFPHGVTVKEAVAHSKEWLKKSKIDLPQEREFERDIASAYSGFERKLFEKFSNGLSNHTKESILECLFESDENEDMSFSKLKADAGRIGLETILSEIEKLKYINDCKLSYDRLKSIHRKIIQRLYQRISSESTWEVKRHPGHIRETLLCIFYMRDENKLQTLL